MRIAVAGGGKLGQNLMRPLLDRADHEVVAVLQNGRKWPEGLKRTLACRFPGLLAAGNGVLKEARRHKLPVFWLNKQDEAELAPLRTLNIDLILVGGFGIIFKAPLLAIPRIGCVNAHSSLLPRHRGPNPFGAVILAGDAESGVTFHVMTEGIDSGDILDQTAFKMDKRDTVASVYRKACDCAGDRVLAVMDQIAEQGLVGRPQEDGQATYDKHVAVDQAWIDWNQPAQDIVRFVRGLSPNPMARFMCRGKVVRLARAHAEPGENGVAPGTVTAVKPFVKVATADGCLVMRVAYRTGRVLWLWPNMKERVQVGEQLTERADPQ